MVNTIVNDIYKSLKADIFMSSLMAALTLPDICGSVAYPNEKNYKRYIDWYDSEITNRRKEHDNSDDMAELTGSVVYSLRCCLLHEGNPNINNEQMAKNNTKPIDKFILTIEHSAPIILPIDVAKKSADGKSSYTMSIRGFCYTICDAAQRYYEANKDKFHFDYEIEDTDEKLRPFREALGLL